MNTTNLKKQAVLAKTAAAGSAAARAARDGFTLIEILVVIGIIAILAAIVIIAINPARQFAQARNSQRTSNVNAILNAVGQKLADDKGNLTGCAANIPVDTFPVTAAKGKVIKAPAIPATDVDLGCLTPTYIPTLPFDPTNGAWTDVATYNTGYRIFQDATGRITVFAPTTEPTIGNPIISVTR